MHAVSTILTLQLNTESPQLITILPLEVADIITDFLFDDKIALANMSLVCRAFLPSARLHLFETLTLSTDQFWEGCRIRDPEIVDTFTSFAPLVHHLEFLSYERNWELESWARVFLPFLSIFKGVTSLSLPYFPWIHMPVEIRSELFTCFSGVLELFIICGYFSHTADIVWLTLQFPLLEHLYFEKTEWDEDSIGYGLTTVIPSDAQAFSNLSSLTISGDMESVIYWILSLERMPSLRTLYVTTLADSGWEPVGQFIRALAPTLKHLTLEFLMDTHLRIPESASKSMLLPNTV